MDFVEFCREYWNNPDLDVNDLYEEDYDYLLEEYQKEYGPI